MIEVTSRHMECTHFNVDYSQMPAVALHHQKISRIGFDQQKRKSHHLKIIQKFFDIKIISKKNDHPKFVKKLFNLVEFPNRS